ncbi:MAG TPA: ArsR family transcriptional regulator [Polyangiaceae bacterium]|nr:ArsR family transcriptional regulator [Polyangiaceae bacterium]
MRDLAIIFGALADPARLEMLAMLLHDSELCVYDSVETLRMSQFTASRHLRYRWNAQLLEDCQAGLWMAHRLSRAMDGGRQTLVKALDGVFKARDLSEPEGKLAKRVARKGCGPARSTPPKAKKPARSLASNGKPRAAAEAR